MPAERVLLRSLCTLSSSSRPGFWQKQGHPALCYTYHRSAVPLAALTKPTVPPQPGTVSPYEHHVFIRPAPPDEEGAREDTLWWPPVVEKHPALLQAFAAVAKQRHQIEGVVKVTAFEHVMPSERPRPKRNTCDLMIFPAGVVFEDLTLSRVREVVEAHVKEASEDPAGEDIPDYEHHSQHTGEPLDGEEKIKGMAIFVCTHGSRDCRCGVIGISLARRLNALVREQGLDLIRVFQVSHVGGHKYAGNVLVYGHITPCDGDWFGGIDADNAEEFLDALVHVDVSQNGGAEHPTLRRFWRGRMGLSKEEQLHLFENSTGIPQDEPSSDVFDDDLSGSDSEGNEGSSSSDSMSDSSSDSESEAPDRRPQVGISASTI